MSYLMDLRFDRPGRLYRFAGIRTPFLKAALVLLGLVGSALAGYGIVTREPRPFLYLVGAVGGILMLLRPWLGLYLMLFLVPLERLGMMEGVTLARYVGIATLLAWMANKLVRKEPVRPPFSTPLFAPMSVLLLIGLASGLWSPYVDRWRINMVTVVQLVVWVIVLIDLIDSPKRLKWVMFLFLLGSMVSFSTGIYRFFEVGFRRGVGGFGGANAFASLGTTVVPFTLFLITERKGGQWFIGVSCFVLALLAVGVSISRANIAILLVLLVLQLRQWGKLKVNISRILVVMLVLVALIPVFPWEGVNQRFGDLFAGDEILTPRGRGAYALKSVEMILDRPLLGYGLGNAEDFPGHFLTVHNSFLQVATELGILGVLTFTWLWITAWRLWWKTRRKAKILQNSEAQAFVSALGLSLFGYMLYSLTVSNQSSKLLWLLIALAGISYRIINSPDFLKQSVSQSQPEWSPYASN